MKHCTPLSIALGAFFDEIRRTTLVNGKILSIHEVSRITRMGESTYMRLKKGIQTVSGIFTESTICMQMH
ncbi:hypothetical protein [Phocaeicola acetigenes]|jgi:hypothetical protein|uniref:Uncharacterized protein n=1 Tax=Phocaeicola acetigenes TaxID=3016083 RepID=A0ABT4PHA7_9BACT|nr:hypothetical protein [Phocaeicola sp. KGMB11183]MCZ8372444.1 hypothetical protein [Phocaeicola sp. KGMB11183]